MFLKMSQPGLQEMQFTTYFLTRQAIIGNQKISLFGVKDSKPLFFEILKSLPPQISSYFYHSKNRIE